MIFLSLTIMNQGEYSKRNKDKYLFISELNAKLLFI